MKTSMLSLAALFLLVALCGPSHASNDRINPADYICAELVTAPGLSPEPPLFPALQLDGWVAAELGEEVASPEVVMLLVGQAYQICLTKPADKVVEHWKELRSIAPSPESKWKATKTTCREFALDSENASGFIIWLDAYNRQVTGSSKSILNTDEDVQTFIDACMLSPNRTMLEVLRETAK